MRCSSRLPSDFLPTSRLSLPTGLPDVADAPTGHLVHARIHPLPPSPLCRAARRRCPGAGGLDGAGLPDPPAQRGWPGVLHPAGGAVRHTDDADHDGLRAVQPAAGRTLPAGGAEGLCVVSGHAAGAVGGVLCVPRLRSGAWRVCHCLGVRADGHSGGALCGLPDGLPASPWPPGDGDGRGRGGRPGAGHPGQPAPRASGGAGAGQWPGGRRRAGRETDRCGAPAQGFPHRGGCARAAWRTHPAGRAA